MRKPNTSELLQIWEQAAGEAPAARALLLMTVVSPEIDDDVSVLARWSIGRRDRTLLDLRDALFGPELHCLTSCASCGESVELDLRLDDIRVPHGESGRRYRACAGGYDVHFRLPDSTDLLALDGEPGRAERQILARCILEARTEEGDVDVAELPEPVLRAVNNEMSEADPQAEILLEVTCPTCSSVFSAFFDIVSHLWTELDDWARHILREVHALAVAYGWSEAEILQMSPARRRAYLELTGNCEDGVR